MIAVTCLLAAAAAVRWSAGTRGTVAASASANPQLGEIDRLAGQGDWPALADRARDEDESLAVAAVQALGRGGRQSLDYVLAAMHDPRADVRCVAVVAIAKIGTRRQADAVAATLDQDTNARVRGAAATCLGRLRAFDHLDHLLAAMDDPEVGVRARAARAVERIAGIRFGFDPAGPRPQRLNSIEAHRRDWQRLKDRAARYWTAAPQAGHDE